MKISCGLVTVKDGDQDAVGLSPGMFLEVYLNDSGEPVYIDFSYYEKIYEEAKHETSSPRSEPVVVEKGDSVKQENPSVARFSKVVKSLSQKMGITDEDYDDEILVKSNLSSFLELPWEEIAEKNVYVIREVPAVDKVSMEEKEGGSLLFLASHAVNHEGVKLDTIQGGLNKEIHSLVCTLKESEKPTSFRLNPLLLSWHATKDFVKSVNWGDYSYVHMIMHGTEKGEILLERPESHKQADPITSLELLDILKEYSFKLSFLSFCYSGGGSDKSNLAFELTSNGISKYVIGYSGRVGGDSTAPVFAESFYERLIDGDKDKYGQDKIPDIYKEALDKFYTQRPSRKYVPFLYVLR